MKAILLISLLATSALAAPRTANLHLLYGGDDRANQNWSTLDSAYGRLSLFLGSPSSVGVGATTLFNSFNTWSVQQRFTGTNGGIDFDGQGIAAGTALGVLVEDDIGGTGIVLPGSAGTPTGFGPAYLGADSKTQATAILESHNSTTAGCPVTTPQGACADSVLSLRRSRGTGHGTESQTKQNDYLGTIMMQGWNGTAGQSYNGGYGQAMGLECYTSEDWDSTHRGTRCSFYSTPNRTTGLAENAACSVTPGSPYSCCTTTATGTCTTTPVEVWGTSETGQFDVKGQTVFSNTLFQQATSVPSTINQLSYQDSATQTYDYVTQGTQGSGNGIRVARAVPKYTSISNSTSSTTVMTLSLAENGPLAAGICSSKGCAFTIDVTANAVCTTVGTKCNAVGQTISAKRTYACSNINGTLNCAAHVVAGDSLNWYADTLNAAITAQPLQAISTSTTNANIQVQNPELTSVFSWAVTADIVSSGL